jgi:hypothetical protein
MTYTPSNSSCQREVQAWSGFPNGARCNAIHSRAFWQKAQFLHSTVASLALTFISNRSTDWMLLESRAARWTGHLYEGIVLATRAGG